MSETIITVRGEHSAWFDAERALVSVAIGFDGPDRDAAFASATAASAAVRETITDLHDAAAGPITSWSADSVRIWSQRPWSDSGAQLDPVHYAALHLSVTFTDFSAMSAWIERVVQIAGVAMAGIRWTLTDGRITAVTAEVRSRAVKDAVAKATVFAQSIGLGSVTATAVADPGMLGGTSSTTQPQVMTARSMSLDAAGGDAPLALKPEQIEVSAAVDARFIAR